MRKEKSIYLPQVKSIHFNFDHELIHTSLKKKNLKIYEKLHWPEAVKAHYKKVQEAKIKLLHVRSCIDKALTENILPMEECLEKLCLRDSVDNYIKSNGKNKLTKSKI